MCLSIDAIDPQIDRRQEESYCQWEEEEKDQEGDDYDDRRNEEEGREEGDTDYGWTDRYETDQWNLLERANWLGHYEK